MQRKPCLKCGTTDAPTKHHVYPRRHFEGYETTIPLCRPCHDKIEELIPKEIQPIWFYWQVVYDFLQQVA